jgi:hypothetical protein
MLHFSNKTPSVGVVENNNHHTIKAYWGQGSADHNPQIYALETLNITKPNASLPAVNGPPTYISSHDNIKLEVIKLSLLSLTVPSTRQ